ncbi:MAG: OB-fold domain-containing protein [Acidimicrobiia bacterium]
MTTDAYRPTPRVTALTEAFWTGGRDGVLRIQRCTDCGYFVHPPGPVCPRCLGRALEFAAVSGRGHVAASTVNHQAWYPDWETPYVVAIVELVEQPGLRCTTNIVDCPPHDVTIGMPVEVQFAQRGDVWLPRFRPAASGVGA